MYKFDELNKLSHLTWKIPTHKDQLNIELNSLIEASLLLHKLTPVIYTNYTSRSALLPKASSKHRHQCLKILDIDGFTGAAAEANTTSLEQIILYIRRPLVRLIYPIYSASPCEDRRGLAHLGRSRKLALKLKRGIPPGVSLHIM